MSNELLEKVITTSTIGTPPSGGGLLAPEQSNRFIDYMFDETTLGGQVRTIRMRANEVEVDKIAVGTRLVRLATEAVDDGVNAGVTFSKISITTVKLRLDWELSAESLEDNLEGEALEDHIARLMAAQAANDIEDLAINGDTTLSGDPLLKSFDGWRKRLLSGAHVLDNAAAVIDRGTFNKAIKAMPRNFMQNRRNLKFFTSSSLIQDWLFSVQLQSNLYQNDFGAATSALGQPVRTEGQAGFQAGSPFGVPLQEVPLFPDYDVDTVATGTQTGSDVWLLDTQNLLWGVKREIQVFREFKPKKDTIEYTMFTRVGTQVENTDAAVIVKNVAYAA